jgi:hypothetical protein
VSTTLSQLIEKVEPRVSRAVEPRVSRAADSHTFGLTSRSEPFFSPVVIRLATAGDQPRLRRLAQLDSAQEPEGQTLIGEVQGEPVAAVSLADGRSIADPFVLAGPILELVRLRARQLGPQSRSGRARSPRRHH